MKLFLVLSSTNAYIITLHSTVTINFSFSQPTISLPKMAAFGALHFAILVISCLTVYCHGLEAQAPQSSHPPTYAPAPSPYHPKGPHPHPHPHPHHHPVHHIAPTPAKSPEKPPTPRRPLPIPIPQEPFAVRGVVLCKQCKYIKGDLWAAPLANATVKLVCGNKKMPVVEKVKTDKNGFFLIEAPKTVTTRDAHNCRVYLLSSPSPKCNLLTNVGSGLKGAALPRIPAIIKDLPYVLYTVGPFAFEPYGKTFC